MAILGAFREFEGNGGYGLIFSLNRPKADSVYKLQCPFVGLSTFENLSSRWTGDFWSRSILLILPYF